MRFFFEFRAPSGVDFDERNRKAAEKKRAEQMEERRRQEEVWY